MSDSSCCLCPGPDGRTAWLEEHTHLHVFFILILIFCLSAQFDVRVDDENTRSSFKHSGRDAPTPSWDENKSLKLKFTTEVRVLSLRVRPPPDGDTEPVSKNRQQQHWYGREWGPRVKKQIHVLLNLWIRSSFHTARVFGSEFRLFICYIFDSSHHFDSKSIIFYR